MNRNGIWFGGVPMQGEDPALLAIWYSVKFNNIEIGTKISSEHCILSKPHSARHSRSPQTSASHSNKFTFRLQVIIILLVQVRYYLITQCIL